MTDTDAIERHYQVLVAAPEDIVAWHALADIYEEVGHPLAAGVRWMVANGKRPMQDSTFAAEWIWWCLDGHDYSDVHPSLFKRLSKPDKWDGIAMAMYKSCQGAVEALASVNPHRGNEP